MVNRHRGEVRLALHGRSFTLRLTLQALAEIEDAFGLSGLGALGERLGAGRIAARELAALLGAAIRGGGTAIDDDEIAALVEPRDLPAIVAALGEMFELSLAALAEPAPPGPRGPQGAPA